MNGRTIQGLRTSVLLLYCVYAMSPIYLSAMGREHLPEAWSGQERTITMGIVWVNVLLTSLVDDDHRDATGAAAVQSDDPGKDFILIRKTRGLFSETFRLRPLFFQEHATFFADGQLELSSGAVDVAAVLPFRRSDVPISRHLGLSPPYSA